MDNEPNLSVSSNVNKIEMANNDYNKPLSAQMVKDDNLNIDGKSSFDSIVKGLSENVQEECLHDVLSFLLSDRTELRFPDASPHVELFLVNILKDLDYLNCKYFNRRCAHMSMQIIKVLGNNKNVYKCISNYENINEKKVLVYKKQFIPKTYEKTCCDGDACCTTSNLKSITENLHNECPNHHTHKVAQTFKTRFLKTTLRFIKDDSKHNLKYPEMSPMEATFVYSLITRCKEQKDMAPDSYYTPLREVMQIFGLKYFFELSYIDTYPNGKMSLMLEKIPRNIKSLIEGEKGTVNRFRNMKYIKQPKSRTSDEHRAGKVVSRLKSLKPETNNRLFNAFPATPREDDCCRVHEEPEVEAAACAAPEFEKPNPLMTKRNRKGKLAKGNQIAPEQPDVASTSRSSRRDWNMDKRTSTLLQAMSVPIKSDKAMKMMYGMGWDGGALGARGDGITEPIMPSLDIKAGAGFGHTSSPKRQPAPTNQPTPQNIQQPLPVISGVVMQRNEIKNFAVIKKAPNPKTRLEFRLEIFSCILNLITSEATVLEVRLRAAITKKESGFLHHTVRAANERHNIGVSEQGGLNVWANILDEMTSNPDLHIKLTVGNDKTKLILSKDDTPYMSKKKKRKLQKKACIQSIPTLPEGNKKVITNEFLRNLSDTYIATFAGTHVSSKANTGISFRVAILLHILEMVKNNREQTEIEFERLMNDAERDYVENTAVQVGIRKKRGGSKLEYELLTEIKDHIEGFTLRVEFLNDQKTFILHKVEMKHLDNLPRDISSVTYSTDDIDKNEASRCSDDSDVGNDDLLDIDDDEEFENIGNNEVSEESVRIYKEDTNKGVETPDEISSSSDKKSVQLTTNDKAENIISGVSQDEKLSKKRRFEVLQAFEGLSKNTDCIMKTDVHDVEDDLECDDKKLKTEDVMNDEENKDVINENGSATDSLQANGQISGKEPVYNILENDLHSNEKTMEHGVLECDIIDYENDDCKGLKTVEKDLEKLPEEKTQEEVIEVLSTDIGSLENDAASNILQSNCIEVEKIDATIEEEQPTAIENTDIEANMAQTPVTNDIVIEPIKFKTNKPNYLKRVYLVPENYPRVEVNTEFAKNIQILISKQIESSTDLPLLKCHGVQNGALVYSCYSEKTLQWLENVCVSNDIRIIIPVNEEVRYKMSLKMNSFIEYSSAKLFKMLQLYNEGLPTEQWTELNVEKGSDTLTFTVEVDEKSLKYIKESNFTLFAGIDQVQFNVIWN